MNVEFERLIEDMNIGESGWTLPWAASWDVASETIVLNVHYPIYAHRPELHLTPQLQVTRTEDGYYLRDFSDQKFSKYGGGYVGGGKLVPVVSYEKVR